ncbi:hypothetical protein ACSBR2_013583 [Camellia fascicularis]
MLCWQRQYDDKWEHHLYKDDEPQVSNHRIGSKDLRLKLQNKSVQQESARDLREKLSGTMYSQPVNTDPPKPVLKDNKPVRKSVIVEAPEPQTKNVASLVPRKKTQQKTRTLPVLFLPLHFITTVMKYKIQYILRCVAESVDTFLQSLGLEKYSITFQVEEVDMTALVHDWVQEGRYFGHWNSKFDIWSGPGSFACFLDPNVMV